MSKAGKGLFYTGLGLLGLYLLRKYTAGKGLQYYFKGISYSGKKVSDFKIILSMDVVNSSFTPLKLNNLFLNIYDLKTQLGRIAITTPQTFPKNSTTTINLPIQLNLGATIYFLYEIIAKGKKEIQIAGTINSEGLEIPVDEKIPLI
jgi:LEA14-like dessication related protein